MYATLNWAYWARRPTPPNAMTRNKQFFWLGGGVNHSSGPSDFCFQKTVHLKVSTWFRVQNNTIKEIFKSNIQKYSFVD